MDKYYVVMAVDVDNYEQSDHMYLLEIKKDSEVKVIGYAVEFDSCTLDIAEACAPEKTHLAKWFGWDDAWTWKPATLEQIIALDLSKHLLGYKIDMKLSTPIQPM